MQLKHLKSLTNGNDHVSCIQAVAWSLNGQKVAVATYDKVITLYDELGEKKDRFSTKPADATKVIIFPMKRASLLRIRR